MKKFLKKILPPRLFFLLRNKMRSHFDEISIISNFLDYKNGVMFDVGSLDGSSFMPFLIRKWDIYAFEPDKENHKNIVKYLKKWSLKINLSKKAVSDIEETRTFYKSNASTGIPSLLKFNENQEPSHKVNTIVLKVFVENNNINNIDFLKIDVEGYDLNVLKGFDFSKLKPKVIMCEFEDKKTRLLNYTTVDMGQFLENQGYHLVYSIWFPIKEYGIRHEWKKMSDNIKDIDTKEWGNIIAFANQTDYNEFKIQHKI